MDWKTSNHMDGSEIRGGIGLQYFAEDGNTSDSGADMDGFNGDDFLAALEGNDDLENQQTAAEGAEETVQENRRISRQRAAKYRRRRWNSRCRPCRSSTTDSRLCCLQTQCRR